MRSINCWFHQGCILRNIAWSWRFLKNCSRLSPWHRSLRICRFHEWIGHLRQKSNESSWKVIHWNSPPFRNPHQWWSHLEWKCKNTKRLWRVHYFWRGLNIDIISRRSEISKRVILCIYARYQKYIDIHKPDNSWKAERLPASISVMKKIKDGKKPPSLT